MSKVAIFGLGPGGIIGMLEALEKGHSVDVFEKRTEFSRTNGISRTQDLKFLLLRTSELFAEWYKNNPSYQAQFKTTSSIYEKFHLKQLIEVGQFQTYFFNILPFLKDKYPGRLHIHAPLPFADDQLAFKTITQDGTLILTDNITLKVDHIICAEGSGREIAKTLGFRFKVNPRPIHQYWAKFALKIPLDFDREGYSPKETKLKAIKMGFTKKYAPILSSLFEYAAIQIPSWIMYLPSQEKRISAVKQWVTQLYYIYNAKTKDKRMLTPDQLFIENESVFHVMDSTSVNSQFYCSFDDTNVTIIGDARKTACFSKSYGARHAMEQAAAYIKYITYNDASELEEIDRKLQKESNRNFDAGHQKELVDESSSISDEQVQKWAALVNSMSFSFN